MSNSIPQQPAINLEDFSKKSLQFYEQIKGRLEKEAMSRYVAVDYETSNHWLGETASEALSKAKAQFPNKVFYLLQVGSPTAFGVQSMRSGYGFNWAY